MKKIILAVLLMCFLTPQFYITAKSAPVLSAGTIKTYRDVPGITKQELDAITNLTAERKIFTVGCLPSTEYYFDSGTEGYTVELCELLSSFFGVTFTPRPYSDWDTYMSDFNDAATDFSVDITKDLESDGAYYVSMPIAERSLIICTGVNDTRFRDAADFNGMRVGFLEGTSKEHAIKKAYSLEFDAFYYSNEKLMTNALITGEIDVFVDESCYSVNYDDDVRIAYKPFFKLVHTSASFSTANPKLASVITVLNKYLSSGGTDILFDLKKNCEFEYTKYKLAKSFTDEERAYIDKITASGETVKAGLEHDNYPVSFYNEKHRRFEGMSPDILTEIGRLTDIEFEYTSTKDVTWAELIQKLKTGEISVISHLLYSTERKKDFIWSIPFDSAYCMLISRSETPSLETYQVPGRRVGMLAGSAYEELYYDWFGTEKQPVLYATQHEGLDALEHGEIDLYFAYEYTLLTQLNYREKTGFKANIKFTVSQDSMFGFNKNDEILRGIVNKSMEYIDTAAIASDWKSQTFDYSRELAVMRSVYLAVFCIIVLCILAGIVVLFYKNKKMNKYLETTVSQRTLELATSRSAIEHVLNSLDAMIYVSALHTGEILLANKKMEETYCISGAKGKICWEIFQTGMSGECEFCPNKHLTDENSPPVIWEELSDITGRYYQKTDRLIRWTDGKLVHIQHSIDITDLKKTEAELHNLNEHLEALISERTEELRLMTEKANEASRAKSLFLANMSHEIRTPMNAVIGMSELLLSERMDERKRKYVSEIHTSAKSLLGIINDILDLSKIDEGKLRLIPVDSDIVILLKNVSSMMGFAAQGKELNFIEDIRIDTDTYIKIDETRLNQILLNLMSNAVKFTTRGHVCLSAEIIGENIIIEVSDTGSGIKSDELPLIFEAFEQVDMRKNRAVKGTGLGLPITKKLVEMMNGSIGVESKYGKGTVFRVTLPFIPGEKPDKKTELTSFQSFTAPTAQILLVDDIQTNLTVGAGLLRLYGIEADMALSGNKAIELIRSNDYDIVFMDHMMPVEDGIAVTKRIRRLGEKYKNLPVIALTANALNEAKELLIQSGMDDFISKPIDRAELTAILLKWLPEDKIDRTEEIKELDEPYSDFLCHAANIEYLDIETALKRLGGMQDVLEDAIHQTAGSISGRLKKMDEYLSASELEAFTIEAHGFKSSLANIGALDHSILAAELEVSGDSGDKLDCIEKFTRFASIMEGLASELAAKLPAPDLHTGILPSGSDEFLREKLKETMTCLEAYETDEALVFFDELLNFTYGGTIDNLLRKAKKSAEMYEYEYAIHLLESIPLEEHNE